MAGHRPLVLHLLPPPNPLQLHRLPPPHPHRPRRLHHHPPNQPQLPLLRLRPRPTNPLSPPPLMPSNLQVLILTEGLWLICSSRTIVSGENTGRWPETVIRMSVGRAKRSEVCRRLLICGLGTGCRKLRFIRIIMRICMLWLLERSISCFFRLPMFIGCIFGITRLRITLTLRKPGNSNWNLRIQ
ncbi:hypothetical protein OSB04_011120 [Centaurea solstitialis]|uniref:Uncharacterized protein n=1 Tax=Centaurea solstitialis TaxID=347529 RepID=A0AA38WPV0_9ASTR|nr:hypothetical protein OSB04_011120 [Centaurea solstitialis]